MASLILLLIAAITAVDAVIDTSRYEKYHKYRPKATYTDILKAMFLVDFNLSNEELDTFQLLPWPDVKNGTPYTWKTNAEYANVYRITYDGYSQAIFQMDLFSKAFSNVKSNKEIEKPRYAQLYNALYMALNYDFMAQILDPNYKMNLINIIPTGHGWRRSNRIQLLTLKRWRVDLTGIGTRHIDNIIKGNFIYLSDEEKEEVRRQVYRLYVSLDDYVLRILNHTSSANSDVRDEKCNHHKPKAIYKKIMNAADLIDFNLSEEEMTWIQEFAWPTDLTTTSPELANDWAKERSEIESWFPAQNTPKSRKKRIFNALYLIINYDAMGQILDPNYEPRIFNFTRAIQERGNSKDDRLKMSAMQLLHNRWTPSLFGVGFIPGKGLEKGWRSFWTYLYQYFDKANEKNMEGIKHQVCRMRSRLDDLVLDAVRDQSSST